MSHRLEFDSIQISFGGHNVLSSVYMFSETGSITGLLGRNGCGKTTLMKIVFGAILWEQKSVRINSVSMRTDYLSKRLIAYLPQDHLIPEYLTLEKAFALYDIPRAEVLEDFPEAEEMMGYRPAQLSGGYLRIFEIVLTLKSKALFCLLDEPFSGLTPVYIEKIKVLLQKAKGNKGIIITDHLHRHVLELSDNLYLLANGQTYRVKDMEQLVSLGYVNAL
jgi:ABC-type multidrug transport system ATPase subunit